MNRIEEWIPNSCELIIVMAFTDNERLKLWLLSPLAITFSIAFKQRMRLLTKVKFINNTNELHIH